MKRWMWMWMLAGVAAAGMVGGCKRQAASAGPGTGAPSVARPPRLAGPTPEVLAKENRAALLEHLYILEPLGAGKVETTAEGESWTRFANGLMIHDLRPSAEGMPPRIGQTVTVEYIGTLPGSGKVFDHHEAGDPLKFTLGSKDYLKGFSLGLSTMHVGGKRRVYVPADLAYGAAGNPFRNIVPDQPLIFEMELLSVSGEAVEITAADVPKFEPAGPPASAAGTGP